MSTALACLYELYLVSLSLATAQAPVTRDLNTDMYRYLESQCGAACPLLYLV